MVLADGELKKVRNKDPKAFEPISSLKLGEGATLSPNESKSYPVEFQLDLNAPITDTSGSPFVLYGAGPDEKLGQLQLPVGVSIVANELLERLRVTFRFVLKHSKNRKKGTETKLVPPDGKAFSMVEHLMLETRHEGPDLLVHYQFAVKKIDAGAGPLSMTKKKLELEDRLTPTEYRLPSGRFNHDRIEESLRKALDLVESKIAFT